MMITMSARVKALSHVRKFILLVYTTYMYIAILGRQPALGVAELESVYGSDNVFWFSDQSARIETSTFDIEQLGGTQKAGHIVHQLSSGDWKHISTYIIKAYSASLASYEGKITLGISVYGFDVPIRDIQKTGLVLKQKLKATSASLRLIPNTAAALNTATSHHNKLGLSGNKIELLIIKSRSGKVIIAESTGAQNITSLAKRDQQRPKRDAFVGMLPPKLAQIMINCGTRELDKNSHVRILDPFCGTGVILQEAALMHYAIYGTDMEEKMVRYSRDNLNWLQDMRHSRFDWHLEVGDATNFSWQKPINAVICESYLGQPFSAPPSTAKLTEVRNNCDHIIRSFLQNISSQIATGTPLCIAIPAWRNQQDTFTHLPFTQDLHELGYKEYHFKNVRQSDLLYYRENQVVARELLVLVKS
jgi:tRNA G10  N-methylase Trm11